MGNDNHQSAADDSPRFSVYVLQSVSTPKHFYTGFTEEEPEERLKIHNSGHVPHTSKFRPWKFRVVITFPDKFRALDFERYLKTGSGRAFAKKHF